MHTLLTTKQHPTHYKLIKHPKITKHGLYNNYDKTLHIYKLLHIYKSQPIHTLCIITLTQQCS